MNLGEIRTKVLRRLGMRASDATVVALVDEAINASNTSVNTEPVSSRWLGDGSALLAITDTTVAIDLPADCRNVKSVRLESTGQFMTKTREDVDAANYGDPAGSSRSRGCPASWAQISGTGPHDHLYTFPYSSQADNLIVKYEKKCVELALSIDTPQTPAEFHQIHVEEAVAAAASVPPTNESAVRAANARAQELRCNLRFAYRGATQPIQSVQQVKSSY